MTKHSWFYVKYMEEGSKTFEMLSFDVYMQANFGKNISILASSLAVCHWHGEST